VSTLFDISSDEPVKGRKKNTARAAVVGAEKSVAASPYIGKVALGALGKYDDAPCIDSNCRCSASDIIDEHRGQWLLECCFCGTGQWLPAIKDYLKPRQEAFRFRDGLFAGLAIDEVILEPRGPDYLKWAAESHPRPMVREAVKTWLASRHSPV
jgi:hypothetical protein